MMMLSFSRRGGLLVRRNARRMTIAAVLSKGKNINRESWQELMLYGVMLLLLSSSAPCGLDAEEEDDDRRGRSRRRPRSYFSAITSLKKDEQPSADFNVYGQTLNVRVSPWLTHLMSNGNSSSTTITKEEAGEEMTRWRKPSPYVIVGLGVTGKAALHALLSCEPTAQVLVIEGKDEVEARGGDSSSIEQQQQEHGYLRRKMSSLFRGRDRGGGDRGVAAGGGGSLVLPPLSSSITYLYNTSVQALNADAKVLRLSDGSCVRFDKCLVATGAGPVDIPRHYIDRIVNHRVTSLQNSHTSRDKLAEIIAQGHHITIIGSNWSSIELASYLSGIAKTNGWQGSSISMIFPESTPLAKELPRYLSGLLLRRLEKRGVEVISHTSVKYIGRAMDYEMRNLPQPTSSSPPSGRIKEEETNSANGRTEEEEDEQEEEDEEERIATAAALAAKVKAEALASTQPMRIYLTSKFQSLDSTTLLTDHVVIGGSSSSLSTSTSSTSTSNSSSNSSPPPSTEPMKQQQQEQQEQQQGGIGGDGEGAFVFEGHPLEVDDKTGGITVSHELMASSSIYVAGDASFFPCTDLEHVRMNVRSVDHAYHSGWIAGLNMAGRGVRYQQVPLFFGTIPRLGVRAAWIGVCDGGAETHGFWWKGERKMTRLGTRRKSRLAEGERLLNRTNDAAEEEGELMAAPTTAAVPPSPAVDEEEGEEEEEQGLKARLIKKFSTLLAGGSPGEKNGEKGVSKTPLTPDIGADVKWKDSHEGKTFGINLERPPSINDQDDSSSSSPPTPSSTSSSIFLPVNGTGLVFYMDNNGIIRGVLAWGLPPPSSDGLATLDATLSGVVDRAREVVQQGIQEGITFKYDINSRVDTLGALRSLATSVMGSEALNQLGPKAPLYTYAGAKMLTNTEDAPLFRITNNSRSSQELMEEAYEAVVKGHISATPGTNSVPYPFNRG